MLDDNIIIHVVSIRGNQVKIGISAPDDVTILREEIYNAQLESKADELHSLTACVNE